MSKNKRLLFELTLAVILTGVALFAWTNNYKNNQQIEEFKEQTVGQIADYEIVGPYNHYLTYSFVVNSQTYQNRVIPNKTFKNCHKTKECVGRKFKVYYSRLDPNKSRIDLTSEMK
jgi:hypothetical protein